MANGWRRYFILSTAIGWDKTDTLDEQCRQRDRAWQHFNVAPAIANSVSCLCLLYRVGFWPHELLGCCIQFWGHSFIAGATGEILAQANSADEQVLSVELDIAQRT